MWRRFLTVSLFLPFTTLAAQGAPPANVDSLHPISIQEAVALAQRNAPAAVQARGQIRTNNSAVRSAYGAFMPSLTATVGQSKQGGQRFDPLRGPVAAPGSPWQYSVGARSSLELFDGMRRFYDLKSARADVDAAEANETAQRFTIALNVKREYANILAARESEAAARAQLEQAEAQLRASVARVRAGAATMSDSLRSVIQLGNARLALLTAQNNVRIASASLTRLAGTPYMVTANPADTLERATVAVDSTSLMAAALNGPAVVQAERALSSANANVRVARAPYMPTVTMSFNYTGNRQDSTYQLSFGPYAYGRTLSVNLNFPLFNNFTREDALVRAKVSRDNAQAQFRDARLAAQQSMVQQLGALNTAQERIRIQEASVAAAQEDLRVMQQRYTLGASTLLDLLTSQSQLNQARAALIQARQDYRLARAQIEAIIGHDIQ